MVKCPRCESMFDETKRTTCPICFTPLQSSAPAPPPAPEPTQVIPPGQSGSPTNIPPPGGAPSPLNASPNYGQTLPTPLAAPSAPPPTYPQATSPPGGGIPGLPDPARVGGQPTPSMRPMGVTSLTGEVLSDAQTQTMWMPPQPGANAGPMSGAPPPVPPPTRSAPQPSGAARRPEMVMSRSKPRSAAPAIIGGVLLFLVVVAGAGFWLTKDRPGGLLGLITGAGSDPKAQTEKFFNSITKLDWKGIYATTDLDKTTFPTEEDFVQKQQAQLDKNPQLAKFVTNMLGMMKCTAGEPTINGDTATVPVKVMITFGGTTNTEQNNVTLKLVDGVWKVSPKDSGMGTPGARGGMGGMGGFGGFGGMGGMGGTGGSR